MGNYLHPFISFEPIIILPIKNIMKLQNHTYITTLLFFTLILLVAHYTYQMWSI